MSQKPTNPLNACVTFTYQLGDDGTAVRLLPDGETEPLDARASDPSARGQGQYSFERDAQNRLLRLASPDGKTEVFRDNATKYLCVLPDETGAMWPVMRHGRPVCIYLCREEREIK
jgi:hypothetical protein